MSIRTRFGIVVIMQMFHPLVLSRKAFPRAESKGATILWRPGMSSGNVALQIVVGSERLRMFAVFHSANQRVDVNVDKVLLEKLLAFVPCLGRTSVPGAFDSAIRFLGFLLAFPVFSRFFGVGLEM